MKDAKRFTVTFTHSGTTGTIALDDVRLEPNAARMRTDVLPLPTAPELHFRSFED